MSALIIYKSAPEIFPIEQVSSQVYKPKWQPQDIRRCSTNVLRSNTEGKHKLA